MTQFSFGIFWDFYWHSWCWGGMGWGRGRNTVTFFIDVFIDLRSNLTLRCKIFFCTCTKTLASKAKEGHVNQALWDWTHSWQWRFNVGKDLWSAVPQVMEHLNYLTSSTDRKDKRSELAWSKHSMLQGIDAWRPSWKRPASLRAGFPCSYTPFSVPERIPWLTSWVWPKIGQY